MPFAKVPPDYSALACVLADDRVLREGFMSVADRACSKLVRCLVFTHALQTFLAGAWSHEFSLP